ncbi:carbohydrate ABC transporter permease [Ruminiclostridium cellobioparum]|jgi:alpha-1,4-digalacturonate transport system permease protein|uniref:ABC-type sugar transport system, permease component n=1 Tax=Ruminiclostridium cellobioparum subsp. termitidis CT1112 TaxID=1195236 RepID=S0FFL2_RUMCE|nr:carbohydrate ABC transporter permease [Ruminiclostridium cellobioparum]EMS69337.1 ABC-type sugar transport system, permease component [Ruminiclostridium cellobioparum subsp. termitidis CT1112]
MIKKEVLKDRIAFILLLLAAMVTLFPLFWMLSTALKPSEDLFAKVPILFPSNPQWSNFAEIFSMAPFARYFLNSGIVATVSVLLTVFINLLAGYTFAKYRFRGRKVLFLIVLSTLMIPMQIIMVPNFIILSKLGWLNSYAGLIIPRAAEAFGLFLSKQFMDEIPYELIEAARIDGESEFKIFVKIILPNCKPLIAILSIFTFMWRWNDFLWPLITTSDKDMYTVQLGLASFVGQFYVEWNSLMAISLLAIIPVLIVFLMFQKLIVQGIVTTGIKG